MMSQAESILEALGGRDNIASVEACITRIRVDVKDTEAVNEAALEAAGAFGVVGLGRSLQLVMGPRAEEIAADLQALR